MDIRTYLQHIVFCNLYTHAHAHMHHMTTTISLTKEAYRALVRLKRNGESFSDLILRLAKEKERVWSYFGSIPLTEREEHKMMEAVDQFKKQMGFSNQRVQKVIRIDSFTSLK